MTNGVSVGTMTLEPITGASLAKAITSVSGSSSDVKGKNSADSKADAGKEKDTKKTDPSVPETAAEKQAKQNAAIIAALGHKIPDGKDLVDIMKHDPGQFPGIDPNPSAKGGSAASSDAIAQVGGVGSPAAGPNFGFANGGGFGGGGASPGARGGSGSDWSGIGAYDHVHGDGVTPNPGAHNVKPLPSLAELNARADAIAAAGGASIERVYDPEQGLQQVLIHDANDKVQRQLAQLAPLYKAVTGQSPTNREVQEHDGHKDIILTFNDKPQSGSKQSLSENGDQAAEQERQAREIEKQRQDSAGEQSQSQGSQTA